MASVAFECAIAAAAEAYRAAGKETPKGLGRKSLNGECIVYRYDVYNRSNPLIKPEGRTELTESEYKTLIKSKKYETDED